MCLEVNDELLIHLSCTSFSTSFFVQNNIYHVLYNTNNHARTFLYVEVAYNKHVYKFYISTYKY